MNSAASSWAEARLLIDKRPALHQEVLYGISMAISGKELWIDFGDELHGEIAMAKLVFRDERRAMAGYCKGIRMEIKVVAHPEHEIPD